VINAIGLAGRSLQEAAVPSAQRQAAELLVRAAGQLSKLAVVIERSAAEAVADVGSAPGTSDGGEGPDASACDR